MMEMHASQFRLGPELAYIREIELGKFMVTSELLVRVAWKGRFLNIDAVAAVSARLELCLRSVEKDAKCADNIREDSDAEAAVSQPARVEAERAKPAAAPDLEVISQQVEEEGQCMAPVQLVSFAYRDLPLAALDISLAGSQLISNLDEEDNREGAHLNSKLLFGTGLRGMPMCGECSEKEMKGRGVRFTRSSHHIIQTGCLLHVVKNPVHFFGEKNDKKKWRQFEVCRGWHSVAIRSNWLKPCCGRRAALWQVCLLSAGFNCFLVACVILVVVLLSLELLIDTKLLQCLLEANVTYTIYLLLISISRKITNAFQFAGIIHWISLVILSVFFTETVFRIVVLGIWDYIENKVEVFDGAVIVLSLAPMVASTVANGPSSPWDAISLIITLRIWRVKRIIDGEFSLCTTYVLQVKVEMELELQQYEKAKAVREEQLERLTQICQEQAVNNTPSYLSSPFSLLTLPISPFSLPYSGYQFEIRQLRAHLAQQDLDLAAEREAAMQIHHVWGKQSSSFQEVDGLGPAGSDAEARANSREPGAPTENIVQDDMNNYISQYYSEPSSDIGVPDPGARIITTAAIDVHLPNNPSQLPPSLVSADGPGSRLERTGSCVSEASATTVSRSSCSFTARQHSVSSQTLGSSSDCSSTVREASTSDYSGRRCCPPPYCSPLALGTQDPSAVVKELLSSLSEDSCLAQKGRVNPVNLKLPSPAGSVKASPELEHRVNIYNKRNQESRSVFQTKPLIHLQGTEPSLDEKYRLMEPTDTQLTRVPDT
ncbi:hypothetical protein NFI96_031056 [Prochilodus magdalenae]|nr:hypothetical protein NFI96_031056 [Prochilodus magdalenae]